MLGFSSRKWKIIHGRALSGKSGDRSAFSLVKKGVFNQPMNFTLMDDRSNARMATLHRVTATEARVHFGEIIRRVTEVGPIMVERAGQPQVVILSVADFDRLRKPESQAVDALAICSRLRRRIAKRLKGRELTPPEDLIRQDREERERRILGLP